MTDSKHVINMQGPWQWADAPASGSQNASSFQRFRFPAELDSLREQTGSPRIVLARAFGRPSGLTDRHRVELVVDPLAVCRGIVLNDEPLVLSPAEGGSGRCDITPLLQWRNGLRITYQLTQLVSSRSERLREVRMEIVEAS